MNVRKDFLHLVQDKLCHGRENACIVPGPRLHCEFCGNDPIPDVYKYICGKGTNHLHPCELAQAFYEMTGDPNVPVNFVIVADNILPTYIEGQLLSRLRNAVHFYKVLLAPFTQHSTPYVTTPEMDSFMVDYAEGITSLTCPQEETSSNAQFLLKQLLENLHKSLRSKDTPNPFEHYVNTLVPYVKLCDPTVPLLPADDDDEANLASNLVSQLRRSQWVRDQYSRYSFVFDLMHVMVGCYVSSCNKEVVANWVLEFISCLCGGKFFWKQFPECPLVVEMKNFIQSEVSHRKKPNLYYVLREIQRGNAAESLSSFLPNYLQLEMLVKEKFRDHPMAASQLFPAILFEDVADHLGFAMHLGHVAFNMNMKTGTVKKGTFQAARKFHVVVAKCVDSVRRFDAIKNIWTMDTFHQFLESEPNLEQELVGVAKLLLVREDVQ